MKGKIPDMSKFGLGIIVLGLICIVTGILGCLTGKCKKCWFATLFIILAGIVGLVCLILGFIMMGGAGLVSKAVDMICTGVNDSIQNDLNRAVNNNMCRDRCKCNPGPNNANKDLWMNAANFNGNRNDLRWADNNGQGVNNYMECYDAQG